MKLSQKSILAAATILLLVLPGAYGLDVGGGTIVTANGASSSQGGFAATDRGVSYHASGTANLNVDTLVSNIYGDTAEIDAQINGATSRYDYGYKLYPKKGILQLADHVWAEETNLNVPSASYIKAFAQARNRLGYVSAVSTEINGGSLLGYSNLAAASKDSSYAAQSISQASGSVTTHTVSGHWNSKQGSIISQLIPIGQWTNYVHDADITTTIAATGSLTNNEDSTVSLTDNEDSAVSLKNYKDNATKSPTSDKAAQEGHITGSFTSTSTATGASATTRTSNYGIDYDVNMKAARDLTSKTSGILGYYVDGSKESNGSPMTITRGIDAASKGDTINVAAGSYSDDLNQKFYDKDISLKAEPGVSVKSITLDRSLGGSGQDFANIATGKVNVNTNTIANTQGKIQDVINLVNTGGTVNIGAGTYKENIVIDKTIKLIGAGKDNTFFDGTQAGSVFTIGLSNPSVSVTLSGMTIQNGKSAHGGGIQNYGILELKGVSITGNQATPNGGGISNTGTVTLKDDSSITYNHADNYGGGIDNYHGIVNIYEGCLITTNNAGTDGGGIFNNLGTVNFIASNGNTLIGYDPNSNDNLNFFGPTINGRDNLPNDVRTL